MLEDEDELPPCVGEKMRDIAKGLGGYPGYLDIPEFLQRNPERKVIHEQK